MTRCSKHSLKDFDRFIDRVWTCRCGLTSKAWLLIRKFEPSKVLEKLKVNGDKKNP